MIPPSDSSPPVPLASATPLRRRVDELKGVRRGIDALHRESSAKVAALSAYLAIADGIEEALDRLSEQLFGDLVKLIEEKLTIALQEVLEQPIALKVERECSHGSMSMTFSIIRDGQPEDIMRGQGGSVANILSVGLRLFALTTLDRKQHRRFLVLDEQDCWLRPALVPQLVKIVSQAGKELGFQTLMISHHEPSAFDRYAQRIYHFTPAPDGVIVRGAFVDPQNPDAGE